MTRQTSNIHLNFIRGLPCAVCGNNIETQAAHVRMSDARAAKVNSGIGEKPDDRWTVPLCNFHHMLQHEIGEGEFWSNAEIDPIFLAMALHSVSGDQAAGEMILQANRHD